MLQNHAHASYVLLAVALAASLLYRPVIAADPEPVMKPASEAISGPVRQDFDSLISEIESRQPAQAMPAQATTSGNPDQTTDDALIAAKIQIGILQQAVVAALAARAEAEAQLETLWRDSRAEIDALKAAQAEGASRISALETELVRAKGSADGAIQTAAFRPSDEVEPDGVAAGSTSDDMASIAPAAGPTELMLHQIHFNPGSSALTPGGERKTLEAAEKIKALGASNVRVAGYTDSQGPATFNKHLSLQRARSIAQLLESVGVSTEIIEVQGNGEDGAPEPTADQVSEPLNRCAGIFAIVDLPAGQAQQ